MWTYSQQTGNLFDPTNSLVAAGYSGCGLCKNDPDEQDKHDEGPIPIGNYTIQAPVDTEKHGPFVLWLTPDHVNQMYGRSGFGIHGDSKVEPGTASNGCIIMSKWIREKVWNSGDRKLVVKRSV